MYYFPKSFRLWLSRSCTNLKGLTFHSIISVTRECFFSVANGSKILYRVARTQHDCSKRNSNIRTYAQLLLPWLSPIHYSGLAQFIPIRPVLPVWLRNLGLSFTFFRFEISYDDNDDDDDGVTIGFFLSFFEAQKSVFFVRFGSFFRLSVYAFECVCVFQ